MATLLYRLGRFSFRHAWTVIAVWLVLFVAVLGGGFALGGQTNESFEIPGTESQEALDRLEAVFPQVAGASAQGIVVAPDGESVTDDDVVDTIGELVDEISAIDGIESALSPFDEFADGAISDDDQSALIQIQFDGVATDVTEETLDELVASAEIGRDAGLDVEFGGQVFQENEFGITVTEVFGVIFAGIVLFITFGSLRAAGMPLASALVGVGIVIGGITGISAFATVSSTAPLLALMIGLAVGIDYSLFILSRHRNQLAVGEDPEESTGIAVGTAGSAVVFAGVTVIIALLGLLVVGIPFLSVMGVGAAFAVLIAIFVAVTLLPAFLGLAGSKLTPKPGSRAYRRAIAHDDENAKPTMGARWVGIVMKAPILAALGVVAILGTLAVPALSLELSLPDNGSEAPDTTQRQAYDLISDEFGPGYNGPLVVAIDITQTVDILDDLEAIGDEIGELDDVAAVSQGIPSPGLDTAIIQVTPESGPSTEETKALVQSIRDLAPSIESEYDTPINVTGATAVGIDISNRLSEALLPFGIVVVGLSIVLLMIVFRSVLVPVKAALGFLLSVVASFGVVVAIFQWGWLSDLLNVATPGPILSFMPILLMAVLFGLAMDYEVFLVSGMREEFVKTKNARLSVRRGFSSGARVVTAAALIMFFVFFAFVPEGSGTIKPIALGLAVGIAFDAFLVRMTLVPAIMTLLGRHAWWLPAWLDRILPNLDIEGERLGHHRDAVDWVATREPGAIVTEDVVVGTGHSRTDPVTVTIPDGSLVLVTGDAAKRRVLLAGLAGRVELESGRASVAGRVLPTESGDVARLVALTDLDGRTADDGGATLGSMLAERLRFTRTAAAGRSRGGGVDDWISRAADATSRGETRVRATDTVSALEPADRAFALALLAIAEGAPIVMLDEGELGLDPEAHAALLLRVSRLAPASTTLLVGTSTPLPPSGADLAADRVVVTLDLSRRSLEPSSASKGVLS
ncbi:MMPL family transporter [Marisediminicola sp. LYQ134]|uniref:MMPL family transporter n=1 Tax=Marisediminicola sp. LYQ134 TaxID=3391061 RepID=UPI003983929C